jgi:hypothetical protein
MRRGISFQGKVFLARIDPQRPDNVEWINCPMSARYTYESGDLNVQDLYIENNTDLQSKLPLSVASFSGYLSEGKRLRVRFASAGSFQLAADPSVTSEGECGRATHYASTISVGAYTVSQLTGSEGGGEVSVSHIGSTSGSADSTTRQDNQMGDLRACGAATNDPSAPPKGCQMPLEIMFLPIGRRTETPPPRPDNNNNAAPSPTNLPSPAEPPRAARPSANHANCSTGLRLSGDPVRDLKIITDACGEPLGLTAMGSPVQGSQKANQPMDEYPVNLVEGACYRIFATATPSVQDLDTGLRGPDGEWVAKDTLDDNYPILKPDGPFCVEKTGTYSLKVSVARGEGSYAVQVWKVRR